MLQTIGKINPGGDNGGEFISLYIFIESFVKSQDNKPTATGIKILVANFFKFNACNIKTTSFITYSRGGYIIL